MLECMFRLNWEKAVTGVSMVHASYIKCNNDRAIFLLPCRVRCGVNEDTYELVNERKKQTKIELTNEKEERKWKKLRNERANKLRNRWKDDWNIATKQHMIKSTLPNHYQY